MSETGQFAGEDIGSVRGFLKFENLPDNTGTPLKLN
jgi:hypothetical protein